MSETNIKKIIADGLWVNNAGLVQLLGLCPLLAVSNTAINGLGLGLATTLTLILSNSIVSIIKDFAEPQIRIPIFVLIIASIVTTIEFMMNAWLHELYLILGIFIPLIVTNCTIIARAESFASRNNLPASALDGLMMGLGFSLVLALLGAIREMIGSGTLLNNAHLLFGEGARHWGFSFGDDYPGMLIAILPPGAFFGLGLLVALKNLVDERKKTASKLVPTKLNPTTGDIA